VEVELDMPPVILPPVVMFSLVIFPVVSLIFWAEAWKDTAVFPITAETTAVAKMTTATTDHSLLFMMVAPNTIAYYHLLK
jgi:uncharacterized membrane protein